MENQSPQAPFHVNRKRQLIITALLLLCVLELFSLWEIDMQIEQHFFQHGHWWEDEQEPIAHLIFYQAPKWALATYGGVLGVLMLASLRVRALARFKTRRNLFIVLCFAVVPLTIAAGKKTTNVFCPYELAAFESKYPRVMLLEPNPSGQRGHCFPAGHASGGFALLGFVLIASTRKRQVMAAAGALSIGWGMATYQMLAGRHFLSHSIATMLVAWMVVLSLHWMIFGGKDHGI